MPAFNVAPVSEPRCAANFGCDLNARPKPLVAAQAICLPQGQTRTRWRDLRERWTIVEGRTSAEKGVDAYMFQLSELDFSSPQTVMLRRCRFTWGQPGLQLEFNGKWRLRFPIVDTGGTEPDALFYWHCGKFGPKVRQPMLKAYSSERVEVEIYDGHESIYENSLHAESSWEREGNWLHSGQDQFTFGFRYNGEVHGLNVVRPFRQPYCEIETSGHWVMSLHGKAKG